jgi:Na+/H+ antiporter NhaC
MVLSKLLSLLEGSKRVYFLYFFWILPFAAVAQDITDQVVSNEDGSYTIEISQEYRLADFKLDAPTVLIGAGSLTIQVQGISPSGKYSEKIEGQTQFLVNGEFKKALFKAGKAQLDVAVLSSGEIVVELPGIARRTSRVTVLPAWLSIIPPLVAIVLALVIKEVVASLLIGIFAGAFILSGLSISGFLSAFLSIIDRYIIGSLLDKSHLSVVLFSTMIGGMVALISRNGGMAGIVDKLSRYARDHRSSQLITWFLGIAIFFDDYANTLIVGNTMRPVTDRFKVSREKLAYLVDSTAAPVAAVAFVTTWIGAELGYIKDAVENLGLNEGAYSIFLNSLRYAFYPFLTLGFMLFLILTKRDFGAMRKAEQRAMRTGVLNAPGKHHAPDAPSDADQYSPMRGVKPYWLHAFIPVLLVILITIAGLGYTGMQASEQQLRAAGQFTTSGSTWQQLGKLAVGGEAGTFRKLGIVIGNADAYNALLWASFTGLLAALLITIGRGIMRLHQSVEVMLTGFKTMLTAMLILTLAWSLSSVTEDLRTADFITSLFAGNVPYWILPALSFVIAALIAFATGSSWGTMAILYPLLLPAGWAVAQSAGLDQAAAMEVLYHITSVVLAGSVLGDHCSPISDTTIMSSLASDCDHLAHVRTQLPYALTVGLVSVLISLALIPIGLPWWVNYGVGFIGLYLIVRFAGKPVTD